MKMSDDHSRIARLEEGIKSVCKALDDIKAAAERREQKMDSIVNEYVRFKEHRESVCQPLHARLDDLELRVRALEAFKWKALGAIGVITFIASSLAQFLKG